MEAKEAIMRDREAREAIHENKLEEITTLSEQLALVSNESEMGPHYECRRVHQL